MHRVIRTDNLSFHDIPEDVLTDANRVAPPGVITRDALEAYKLEYEKCAQRYDDVFTAAWTNFSYMAIVAGAILTFGGDRFLPELSALLACFPLLFWWLASFEPLNRYGDKVIDRLSWIELILTDIYALDNLTQAQRNDLASHKGLRHFREFKDREGESRPIPKCKVFRWIIAVVIFVGSSVLALNIFKVWQFISGTVTLFIALILVLLMGIYFVIDHCYCGRNWKNIFFQFLRVRFIVRCFAAVLLITVICLGYRVYQSHIIEHKPLLVRKDSEIKVIPVDFNDNLGIKLEGITAKQAQELIEKAEQQKAAQKPANNPGNP